MANASNIEDELETSRSWLLFRPREVLMSLPVEYRWEFTRRHPYYVQFWEAAAHGHIQPRPDGPLRLFQDVAAKILTAIGVAESMVPPDPHLGIEALDGHDLAGVWEGGAVAPAMFRTLATMLLVALPAAQRAELGRLFSESAEYDSQDVQQMSGILVRLVRMPDPVWSSYPDVPVISINLQMPQRAIAAAVEKLVRNWKQERGLQEHRRRDDKLEEYLAVWDLREGWADGEYDGTREQTFRAIALQSGHPIQTVIDRYRRAFRYLSGHDYTPSLWIRLMAPVKLPQMPAGLTMRRPWRSPNLRPVTESVLLPGRTELERPEFLKAAGITPSAVQFVDLSLDIETLLSRGLTDAEIISELDLTSSSAADLIAELRRRHDCQ